MLFSDRFPNVHWAFMHLTAVALCILKYSQLHFFGHFHFCCGFCRNVAGGGNCNMNHNGWHWMCSHRILWDYIYVQQYFRKPWVACLGSLVFVELKTNSTAICYHACGFENMERQSRANLRWVMPGEDWLSACMGRAGEHSGSSSAVCLQTRLVHPKAGSLSELIFFKICYALESSIWGLPANHMWQNSYIA